MNRVEEFRQTARKNRWNGVIFDVDDTVCDSSKLLWGPAFSFFAGQVARQTGKDKTEVLEVLEQVNNEYYRASESGVHPSKYVLVARDVAYSFNCDQEKARKWMKTAVGMIYLGTPPLTTKAKLVLNEVQQANLKIAFASHSPKGRLINMRQAWDLDGDTPLVNWTTRKRKGREIWELALERMDLRPDQVVAVDDNLTSISAAKDLGINAVWLKPKWKEYAVGDPRELIVISDIGLLVPALIKHFG
jgi:FMN phosphatase YigB (HAD superfamily)